MAEYGDIRDFYNGSNFRSITDGLRKRTGIVYIEPPALADAYPLTIITSNIKFNKVWAQTDAQTVTFNIEQRSLTSPYSTGTDILTYNLTASSSGSSAIIFNSSGEVSANFTSPVWLWYDARLILGTAPGMVVIGYEYEVNE